jgi:acyl transferase domain-containing protein/acyl carrier protein
VLSLDDAARVVALRSQALAVLAGGGAMASLAEPPARVRERLAVSDGQVSVAAVNSPDVTVVSGDPAAVADLVAECEAAGVRARILPVDYASHSAQVERIQEEILAVLSTITPGPARIPMVSAMTGEFIAGPELDASYWYASLRAPVDFEQAIRALAGSGYEVFVEASPHPVLTAPITQTLDDVAGPPDAPAPVVTGTLRRDDGGPGRFLLSLAQAYVRGTDVDWTTVQGRGRRVDLPTYAFQRQRYWPEVSLMTVLGHGGAAGSRGTGGADVLGRDGAESAAEARFWAAIEGGDVRTLAETLSGTLAGTLAGTSAGTPAGGDQRWLDGLGEMAPVLASWRRRERERSVTSAWRYRISWAPVTEPGPAALPGTWLIVAQAGRPSGECVRALAGRGAQVVVAEVDCADADRGTLAVGIAQAMTGLRPQALAGVVSLLALRETPSARYPAVAEGLGATQSLVQALGDLRIGAPLWVLTQGAVTASAAEGSGQVPFSPVQAQVWGMGRVVALEHPDRWGGLIDLPGVLDDRAAARLCAVLAGCGEDQVAIRPSGILARRLVRAPLTERSAEPWIPRGSVLITGGTGAIAGHLARWLARRGAPRLVLASRSGPAAGGVPALAAQLASAGTAVTTVACDSADRTALAGLLARIGRGGPPLTAVMHAAGASQSSAVQETTTSELAGILAAKAAGATWLDELTEGMDLDAFVTFSSAAATWGSAMQPGYAAANAFLDGLVQTRRARGLAGTSVAWGLWDGGGMGAGDGGALLQRHGVLAMDPELAVNALGQVLDGDEGLMTVADVDWERFAPPFTLRRPSPMIGDLPEVRQALAHADVAGDGGAAGVAAATMLAQQLAGLPRAEQDRMLVNVIRAEAAAVLGFSSPDQIEAGRAFRDLGFDSLTAVDLRNRLAAATGLRLPATLVFDYPTPAVLAAFMWSQEFSAEENSMPLVEELDKLDSMLSGLAPDDATYEMVTARLQGCLSKWASAGVQSKSETVAQKIESSSDEEIFEFINNELGRS